MIFRVFAPKAERVSVRLVAGPGAPALVALARAGDEGDFAGDVPGAGTEAVDREPSAHPRQMRHICRI